MRNLIILVIISSIAISKVSADPSDCIGNCLDVEVPYIPHKLCTKFCVCDNGRPVEMSCPADLHFSPESYVCMNPADADCEGETSIEEKQQNFIVNNSNINNSYIHDNNNNYNHNDKKKTRIIPSKSSCLGECGTGINYLVHEDTHKFCLCYFGNKIIMECQTGDKFVPQLNNCVKETDKKKHDARSTKCIGSCPANMQPDEIYLIPHENCNRYCLCILDYDVIVHNCPPDMLFNWPEKKCVDAKLAKCANPSYSIKNFQLSFY